MPRSGPAASRTGLWGALLVGILVAFPSAFGVTSGSWPRTTDLLNMGCAAWLVLAVLRRMPLHRAIHGLLILWALTLPWVVLEIAELGGSPDPPVQRLLIRWIMCGFSAYLIAVLVETPVLRHRLFYGLLVGVAFSALTVLYDFLTFSPLDIPVEELVTLAIYNGKDLNDFVYRAFGIFGHPNGAAGCLLVGVPVVIGLIQEGRWPRWSIVLALAFMGGVFYLTKSRGPLAVAAVLVAYWLWFQTRGFRLPLMLAAAVAILGAISADGWMGADGGVLLKRFIDIDDMSVNAGDRWWTIATSLDLMLHHPFGMGSAYVAPLETATGTSATHNAYLELALMGGIPITVLVVVRLVKAASLLFTRWRPVEAWLAAYLLGIFAFESYFLQVNIQLLTLWLVVSPLKSFGRQDASRARALAPGLVRAPPFGSAPGSFAR